MCVCGHRGVTVIDLIFLKICRATPNFSTRVQKYVKKFQNQPILIEDLLKSAQELRNLANHLSERQRVDTVTTLKVIIINELLPIKALSVMPGCEKCLKGDSLSAVLYVFCSGELH